MIHKLSIVATYLLTIKLHIENRFKKIRNEIYIILYSESNKLNLVYPNVIETKYLLIINAN